MSNNAPAIRFKGFTHAWEQRKLGNILKVNSGKDYKHLNAGDIPVYGTGGYMLSVDESLSEIDAIGIGRKGTINKPQLLFAPFWTVDTLFFMTPLQDNELLYLYALSQNIEWAKMDESTGVPSLSKVNIENVDVCVPEAVEQTAIGSFFRTLDDAITLYKRKLDGLKELKAGYLQQMFPQTGERVPRVRFAGFTEDWEQRKLGDMVTQVVREVPKPDKPYKRISVRSHAKGTFQQMVDEPDKVAMDKLYVVHENDLIVNITFAWEHAIAVATEQDHGLLVSHRFPTFEIDKSDINFIRILVSQESFRIKMDLISPGGAGRNRVLNKNDFINTDVIVPSIKEQSVIGDFFRALDNQITVQTQMLEQLKMLKTAYLQKMFI